jgi:23S rRNA pseudouridine2605 synthase
VKNSTTLLAKAVRDSGACSRRDAKALIDKGQVKVNGDVIYSPCFKVKATDIVLLNDKRITLAPPPLKLWAYHKSIGLITTHKDPQMRRTVFETLPKDFPKVISIGRLDLQSSGLLLLTTSGDFSRFMELPKNQFERVYKVRVFGKLKLEALKELEQGCVIDGITYGKVIIKPLRSSKNNHWLQVTLREGKNREVRKLLAHINLNVTKLIRIQYGPFHLNNLVAGEVKQETIPRDLYENYLRHSQGKDNPINKGEQL